MINARGPERSSASGDPAGCWRASLIGLARLSFSTLLADVGEDLCDGGMEVAAPTPRAVVVLRGLGMLCWKQGMSRWTTV